MEKSFTTQFIKENCGCYNNSGDLSKLKAAYKENNKDCFEEELCDVSINEILDSTIPLKDKFWFICKKVATKEENQQIALFCAEIVLPIFEQKYPENKATRECLETTKLFLAGHISLKNLLIAKNAVDAAAYAAYAAYAAADAAAYATYATYATYAAADADAAAYAAYAAYAAADAAAYATYAAYAAADATYAAVDAAAYATYAAYAAADATYAAVDAAAYAADVAAYETLLLNKLKHFCNEK